MLLKKQRRKYGEHFTPISIFEEFILPEIKNYIYKYIWVDLFAGEGNLILPILKLIPEENRINFFKKHIFLFDIQKKSIEKAIANAKKYGIPEEIAKQNIIQRDTIKYYPDFLLNFDLPVYHITNPPYLYIGYIVKNKETAQYLEYFKGKMEGYQDLYQIALMNDLYHNIKKMIYIIPSNFLFGFSGTNKIRKDFLKYYFINKAIIFEKEVFEYTGVNVAICFFERKENPIDETFSFKGIKINKNIQEKIYTLNPKNYYRAGGDFEEFVNKYKAKNPLKINYYLTIDEINDNKGNLNLKLIDANCFDINKGYKKISINVNENLYNKVKRNILFIRTVDTGKKEGRAGIYKIKDVYNVDGIVVTKAKYRTHPIQIFINPVISEKEQVLLMNYFNLILEYFREKTDSEFLTTYKYSNSEYIRKYLGLSQAKKLIQTFPLLDLSKKEKEYMENLIKNKNVEELIFFIKKVNKRGNNIEFKGKQILLENILK